MATPRQPGAQRRRRRRQPPRSVYRRRRAVALALLLVAIAAAILGARALLGGSPGGGIDASTVPTRKLIGQRLMVRMGGSATPTLLREAHRGALGGVILFPPAGQDVAALGKQVARLQRSARAGGNPPLLVAIDQEGGAIKRLPDGPPKSSPAEMGRSGDERAAEAEGRATGRYLARTSNVDLAPVLDVPRSESSFIATRSFGTDPKRVATLGSAFARGLQSGGVAATAKHFPGLGAATVNTDLGSSLIDGSKRESRADLVPFRAAIEAGVELVMISNATYPAYEAKRAASTHTGTPSAANAPAVFSPAIVGGLLRGRLGFDGVVISDDLEAGAVGVSRPPPEAAVAAARAGVDVLLFARGDRSAQATPALVRAARQGALARPGLEDSYRRIVTLKRSLGG